MQNTLDRPAGAPGAPAWNGMFRRSLFSMGSSLTQSAPRLNRSMERMELITGYRLPEVSAAGNWIIQIDN
jgi:hypothetical protein